MGLWTGERECGLGLTGTREWDCELEMGNGTEDWRMRLIGTGE
jgi:hypothetical protein